MSLSSSFGSSGKQRRASGGSLASTTPKRPSRSSSSSLLVTPSSANAAAGSPKYGTPSSVDRQRNRLHAEMEQLRRSNEDLRKEAAQLRLSVEAEKHRVREAHRERNAATKAARENLEKEKQHIIETASRRAASDKENELKNHYETAVKLKDTEIRQLVKFREDEVKRVRVEMTREREDLVKMAREETEHKTTARCQEEAASERSKVITEMWSLREAKMKVEDAMEDLKAADLEKSQQIRRLKQEHSEETAELLRKSKLDGQRDAQRVRLAERIVQQKETELAQQVYSSGQLEADRDSLADTVQRYKQGDSYDRRSTSSQQGSRPDMDTPLSPATLQGSDQVGIEQKLSARVTRLTSTIRSMEDRLATLKAENSSLQQQLDKGKSSTGGSIDAGAEEKVRKLRRRNTELSTLAKQLQDKLRTVQTELAASQTVREGNKSEGQHYKQQYQQQRAKDQAGHRQQLAGKEQEVIRLKHELSVALKDNSTLQTTQQQQEPRRKSSSSMPKLSADSKVLVDCMSREKLALERRVSILMQQSAEVGHLDKLKKATASLEQEVQDLRKKNEEAEEKVDRTRLLELELESQTARSASLVQCIEQLEDDKKQLASSCAAANEAAQDLQKKMADIQQTLRSQEELVEETGQLKTQLRASQSEVDSVQIECTSLQGQISSLQQELEEVSGDQSEVVRLRSDLKSAESTIGSLQAQLTRILSQANPSADDGRMSSASHLSATEPSPNEVADLRSQVQSLEEECAEKELQCMAFSEQVDKLKLAVTHFQAKLDRADGDGDGKLDRADSDGDGDTETQQPSHPLHRRKTEPSPLAKNRTETSSTALRSSSLSGRAGQRPRPKIRVIQPSSSNIHDNLAPEVRRRLEQDPRASDSSEASEEESREYTLEEEMSAVRGQFTRAMSTSASEADGEEDDDAAVLSADDSSHVRSHSGSGSEAEGSDVMVDSDDYTEVHTDDGEDASDAESDGSGVAEESNGDEEEGAVSDASSVSLSHIFAASAAASSCDEDFSNSDIEAEADKLLGISQQGLILKAKERASTSQAEGAEDHAADSGSEQYTEEKAGKMVVDGAGRTDVTTRVEDQSDEDGNGHEEEEHQELARRLPSSEAAEDSEPVQSDGGHTDDRHAQEVSAGMAEDHARESSAEEGSTVSKPVENSGTESSVSFGEDEDDTKDSEEEEEDSTSESEESEESVGGDSDGTGSANVSDTEGAAGSGGKRPERTSSISAQSVLRELSLVTNDIEEKVASLEGTANRKTKPKTSSSPTLAIVIAKFDYDSVQYSPNDPDEELSFKKGDYIYVHGEPDEDGFYSGELMDGKCGLVPGNFVEPVVAEDQLSDDTGEEDEEVESEAIDLMIPPPTRLTVQRQNQNSSVVIQWTPPSFDEITEPILGYCVRVNGATVETTRSNQTSTTVGDLQLDKDTYVISVRTVTDSGTSCDPQKLLTVGQSRVAGIRVESVKDVNIEVAAGSSVVVTWSLPQHTEHCNWHQVYLDEVAATSTLPVDCCRAELDTHHFAHPPAAHHVYTVKVLTFCEVLQQRLHSPEVRWDATAQKVVEPSSARRMSMQSLPESLSSVEGSTFAVSELQSPRSHHATETEGRTPKRPSQKFFTEEVVGDDDAVVVNVFGSPHGDDSADQDVYSVAKKGATWKNPGRMNGDIISDPLLRSNDDVMDGDSDVAGAEDDDTSSHGDSTSSLVDPFASEVVAEGDWLAKPELYAALYSYDPELQSPNPAGPEEELTFHEGDIIKVLRAADSSGFLFGELKGAQGLVPGNLVEKVAYESDNVREQMMQISSTSSKHAVTQREVSNVPLPGSRSLSPITENEFSAPSLTGDGGSLDPRRLSGMVQEVQPDSQVRQPEEQFARALYSYDPNCTSPNPDAEVELSFNAGDIFRVFGEIDEDGFYQAKFHRTMGLVPSNYIELLSDQIIVEGDDGMLYVRNEGMTGERGIDVDSGDEGAPPAAAAGRARKIPSSSRLSAKGATASVTAPDAADGKKRRKGLVGRSTHFMKKKLLPKRK